jgi:proliferating cell nuclear antigen
MKLMDIDADTLNIPETEYDARVTLPSAEFTRIVRDLSQLGESVRIEVSKEGVRFASDGEAANGSVLLRQSDGSHIAGSTIKPRTEDGEEEEGDGAEGSGSKKTKVKKEKTDGDVDMDNEDKEKEDEDEEDFKPKEDEEGEEEKDDDDEEEEDEDGSSKKRKKKARYLIVCFPFSSLIRPTGRSVQAQQETQDFQVQGKGE